MSERAENMLAANIYYPNLPVSKRAHNHTNVKIFDTPKKIFGTISYSQFIKGALNFTYLFFANMGIYTSGA
jgi:hypothetical protein